MRFPLIIIPILASLLWGCAGEYDSKLKMADAVIEDHPDSALSILRSIECINLTQHEFPYYSLLMTQAQVKNNIPVAADSLISIAFRKYIHDRKGDKGIRSYFYMGEVFLNQEKSRDAILCFLNAYEEAKRLRNDYWIAKSAGRVADIFLTAYNHEEAAKYRNEAIKHFEISGYLSEKLRAEAKMEFQKRNDGKITERLLGQDSLICNGLQEQTIDSILIEYCDKNSMGALIALCNLYEFDLFTDVLQNTLVNKDNIEGAILTAAILRKQNKLSEADSVLLKARKNLVTNEERIAVLYALYQNAIEGEKSNDALALADSIFFYQEAITNRILKESINRAHGDFYIKKASETQEKARKIISIVMFAFVSVCLIAFIIWRIMRLKNIAQRAELDAKVISLVAMKTYSDKIQTEQILLKKEMNEKIHLVNSLKDKLDIKTTKLESLKLEKDNLRKEIDQIRKTYENDTNKRNLILESLFKDKWKTLNDLCEDYYEKGASMKMKETLTKKIESEIKSIGSENGLLEIEDEVNKYSNGIIDRLKIEYPSLKTKDIAFYSLMIAGFSTKAICFILDIQSGNFYVKKGRLIKKLSDSDSQYKEEFLRRLRSDT